ncbi:hypothetical protein RclHR1_00290033 [Rhizophagus clarus]|uniref:Protein kinase domain-containing protein n=1 Tax=Rhizophagus clarus TaxID=94130 RepID=A0A2Z6R4P7_9GLOM|nr:hypothetical protein RclHR1_00290033 [Rhizophagus clarus]
MSYILGLNQRNCIACGNLLYNKYNDWCQSCQKRYLRKCFTKWTSGNKNIDCFIQNTQLKIIDSTDAIFEWIPYNRLNNIKERYKNDFVAVYSATWKDGPLHWTSYPYFYHGISQNPVTKDYIIVIGNDHYEWYCLKCDKAYTYEKYKWCEPCQKSYLRNNFTKWTSGNKNIDSFIQKVQLEIKCPTDAILEWIPYNQFDSIKELSKDNSVITYLAIWKGGPLFYDSNENEYIRKSEEIVLKCLCNSVDINLVRNYYNENIKIHGISQDPDTKDLIVVLSENYYKNYCLKCDEMYTYIQYKWCESCQKKYLRKNFTKWTSGNKNIDRFIQEMQIEIKYPTDAIFEWIPYNQFDSIKELSKDNSVITYSAIWKGGPLFYDSNENEYIRKSEEIFLKCLCNSVDINLVRNYYNENIKIHGISQDPDTKDLIVVLSENYYKNYCLKCDEMYTYIQYKWCESCQKKYLRKNFTKWTSGNKNIDRFIQEMQIEIKYPTDAIFEWIPYNQFDSIKELSKDNSVITYSAIWKGGPLFYDSNENEYIRKSEEIFLKCLCNSVDINLVKKYQNHYNENIKIYGISQDPDTKHLIVVLGKNYYKDHCLKCDEMYTYIQYKWCESCQKRYLRKNFTKWTSENKNIDVFIQKVQLEIKHPTDITFEWIPYNEFSSIKKIRKDNSIAVYSAIWKDGDDLLNKVKKYQNYYSKCIKIYGISQNPDTKDYIIVLNNKYFEEYCLKCDELYTEYKWCKPCEINFLKVNYANWISGNKKIDNFVQVTQEMQLEINYPTNVVFEWIPYNQLYYVKEINKDNFAIIYSAIWKNGPLYWNTVKYTRESNEKVILKSLNNLRNITDRDEFINEAKKYLTSVTLKIYGISQNPNTKNYIMVFQDKDGYREKYCAKCDRIYTDVQYKWCKSCQLNYLKNFTIGNKKVDNFILKMQSKIKQPTDIIFEWIPYDQFNNIEEIINNDLITIYFAIWKNGPLQWNTGKYMKNQNRKVALKYLFNLQDITDFTDEFINEVEQYSFDKSNDIFKIYGISQNPYTRNYIIVLDNEYFEKFCAKCNKIYTDIQNKWCKSCQLNYLKKYRINNNQEIDFSILIQEMQSKIDHPTDIVFEWIQFEQFNNIKVINKDNHINIYLAIWKDGPLYWDRLEYSRSLNKKVALIYLNNSQNITNDILNEIKKYSIDKGDSIVKIHGISQNPHTRNYIMVFNSDYFEKYCTKCNDLYTDARRKWCKSCKINLLKENFTNWTSGNEKIDNFIQEMQTKINHLNDIIFKWIPYDQFNDIKEIGDDGFSKLYLGKWEYTKDSDKIIIVKCLYNLQNSVDEFLNEVKKYSISHNDNNPKIYGVSQHPDTKDYIMILHNKSLKYCVKCNKMYTILEYEWCKVCQSSYLKDKLKDWTSGNEKVNDFIRETQVKINHPNDIIFEWIPYNQFKSVKEIGKGGFAIVYSAIWNDGPLHYNWNKRQYTRNSNKTVALKHLSNSQNMTDYFLNEVREYSINKRSNVLSIYGISQCPDTKVYVIVLDYAGGGNFNNWMDENYKTFYWLRKLNTLLNIINGLKEIHHKQMVHCDFHTGNILLLRNEISDLGNDILISDMGLCGEVGNTDNMYETKIYGVMPYMAPEVLRGKPYSQAADIYSFGMIMYFVATGKQPFANRAHDEFLALDICNGIRPEINEPEAPKCYIDLMKKCWDSNPNNRSNAVEIERLIRSFYNSCNPILGRRNYFKAAEEYRKSRLDSFEKHKLTTHPQAIYTSRLLNPFTKDLAKILTDCLDCAILD